MLIVAPTAVYLDRSDRVDLCNKRWVTRYRPNDGGPHTFAFKCGVWRECPHCRAERAAREQRRVSKAIGAHGYLIETDHETATSIVRLLGKDNYRRYPHADYDYVFISSNEKTDSIISTLNNSNIQDIDISYVEDMPWEEIISVPADKKISGNLGRGPAASQQNVRRIEVECVVSNAEKEALYKAAWQAYEETKDLCPQSVDEVIKAIEERTRVFKTILIRSGYDIELVYRTTVVISEDEIDWSAPT